MREQNSNKRCKNKTALHWRVKVTEGDNPGRVLPAFFPQNFASANVPRVPLRRSPARVGRSCAVSDQVLSAQDSHVALARIFARASICLTAILVLSALVLLAPHIQAESSSATVAVTVPIACSLGTDNSVHNYSATVASGQIVSGLGGTRMSAYCNDNNGYTIYAIGASGGADGNTSLINTLDPSYAIATGTTTSGPISSWAMRLTPGTGTSTGTSDNTTPTIPTEYQSYFAIPSSYTAVASKDSSTGKDTNSTTTGNYITAEYQIYIGTTETSGTYLGRVKYAMLHPYTSGTPKDLETILNEAYDAGILTDNDLLSITDSTTGQTKSYYKMQSLTSTLCSAVNVYGEASQLQMIDSRDNKIYWVTKLEDGHCWMTENLDLGLTSDSSTDGYIALTSENTDLNEYGVASSSSDTASAHGYNTGNGYTCTNKIDTNAATSADCTGANEIITWLPERATIVSNNLSSAWANNYQNPYSYDSGDDDAVDTTMNNAGAGDHGLTGNYYNWTAAIASNASNSFTSSTYSNISNSPKNSVCPKGWRLPTISSMSGEVEGSTNEFRRLNILYNQNQTTGTNSGMAWTQSPLYFPRAGRVDGGSLHLRGSYGCYWSSTVINSAYAYYLYFGSGAVIPEYNSYRTIGFSVRCVLR